MIAPRDPTRKLHDLFAALIEDAFCRRTGQADPELADRLATALVRRHWRPPRVRFDVGRPKT